MARQLYRSQLRVGHSVQKLLAADGAQMIEEHWRQLAPLLTAVPHAPSALGHVIEDRGERQLGAVGRLVGSGRLFRPVGQESEQRVRHGRAPRQVLSVHAHLASGAGRQHVVMHEGQGLLSAVPELLQAERQQVLLRFRPVLPAEKAG